MGVAELSDRSVAILLAVLAAVGLAACGGATSSTSSTTAQGGPSTATTAPATTTTAAKAPRIPRSSSASRREGSAPFRVHGGDNSIPDYGSESSAAQRGEATETLGAYLEARAKDNWRGACSYMGSVSQHQLEVLAKAASRGKSNGCAAAYATLSIYAHASERANPLSSGLAAFRVKGDKAFALFYGSHNQKYMMPMVRERGGWKVNQITPVAYPIGAPTRSG